MSLNLEGPLKLSLCTGLNQNLHDFSMTSPGRFVQERIAVGVSSVNVRAGVDQNPDDLCVAPPDGFAQNRIAVGVL